MEDEDRKAHLNVTGSAQWFGFQFGIGFIGGAAIPIGIAIVFLELCKRIING